MRRSVVLIIAAAEAAARADAQPLQLLLHAAHSALAIAIEFGAANTNEAPAEPFEHGLSLQVSPDLFLRVVVAIPVAFDGHATRFTFDDEINAIGSDRVLRAHAIAFVHEPFEHLALERRLRALGLRNGDHGLGVVIGLLGEFDQLASQVLLFEIARRIERVDDPELIAGAAGGDVEALLESVIVAQRKRATGARTVHEGEENDIPLVALELRRIAAEETVAHVADVAGTYRLEVAPLEKNAPPGRYEVRLEEVRSATAQDRTRIAADRAFAEATLLYAQQTADALRRAIGKYEEAARLYHALDDRRKEAESLHWAGFISALIGEIRKALEYFNQALPILRAVGDRQGEATTLHNIGTVYAELGEKQKALEYYGQALALLRAVGDRQGEAWTLHNIGAVYSALGEKQKALEYYGQALPIRRAVGDRQGEAWTLTNIGVVYAELGEKQKALEYFGQALAIFRAVGDREGEAAALGSIARIERDRGELAQARTRIEAALELIESLRAAAPGPELRATFLASKRDAYEFYIDLLVRLDEREPGRGHDRAAFQASERSRARSLLELLTEARMDVRQGIAPELKERERAVHARIAGIQSQLLRVMSRAKPNPAEVAALEEALKRADAEREQVELEIRRKHPRYAALQYPTPVGVASVQEVLDEQTALLEYVLTRESALLFVLTRADFRVLRLGVTPATIRERVEKLRAAIAEGPRWTVFSNYVLNARWLYQDLIQPAEKWLAGKRELIIVPDGVLHYLPFEVLLTKGELTVEPRELSYLARDYAVRYVPSASVLVELSRPEAERSKPEKTLVAYADPIYGEPDEASAVGKALRSMWGELRRLPRLPYSRQEVERIARLYPDAEVTLFLGAEAREENVKSGEPARYRFVHFAAHGVLNEKQPQYSGIVLTVGATRSGSTAPPEPAMRQEATEDSLLQVYEIFNLKLTADVVVLSACETGLGREVRGEGMVGLTRAFLYAGAQAVVVSLWKVADPATAELMMRFYRQMKAGVGKAEALRRARLELFREGRYVHPYYWAPFVLVGGA